MKARSIARQAALAILLVALATGVFIPHILSYGSVPGNDSGVFLYTAWRILDGQIPYRDVWDHKPPAIFYIDAVGLVLGRGSVAGVRLIELMSLSVAALAGFSLLKRAFGSLPSFFGSVTWLFSLVFVLLGGNRTEEFALPLQFVALYLFVRSQPEGPAQWRALAIGATGAAAFLFRQNLVGVWLAIAIYLLLRGAVSRNWHRLFEQFVWMFAGAAGILAIVVLYFHGRGALADFWDAAFRYNFVYSSDAKFIWRLSAIPSGLRILSQSGVSMLATAGWMAGACFAARAAFHREGTEPLLHLALIGLPVEFVLTTISGRSSPAYYMAWLPMLSVLTSWFASRLLGASTSDPQAATKPSIGNSGAVVIVALLIAVSFLPAATLVTGVVNAHAGDQTRSQAVQYISESTSEGDYVLMWGHEAAINFAAHRLSPTRFVYQYPLYYRGYQSPDIVAEFLQDIMVNKPVLIIDNSPSNGVIPPIDPLERQHWASASRSYELLPEMDSLFDYISSEYRLTGTVGDAQWPVYIYQGER